MSPRQIAAVALAMVASATMTATVRAEEARPSALGESGDAPDPREVAKQRYRAGVAKFQAGQFKDAVDLFLEADQLAPSAALSFNIARAYAELGDRAAALGWYRDYLRRSPDASDAADVQKLIDGFEAELAKNGVQQVTILSEPHGATVVIDDRPVGVTPWTGQLPPGKHGVALRLRGYEDAARDFVLPAEDAIDVTLRLVPARERSAPPPTQPAEAAKPQPAKAPADSSAEPKSPALGIAGWATLGVGVAALGTGVVFEVLRSSSESDAKNAPNQIAFADALDTMDSRQTASRVFVGVGGALVLVGGALLAVDMGLFSSGGGDTAWSVGCGPTGCGASARGRF